MPVLPISDGHGVLLPNSGVVVLAAMLYPTDDTRRAFFQASWGVGAESSQGGCRIPTADEVKALDNGPGRPRILEEIPERLFRGRVVSHVLLFLLHHADHEPREASLRKAVFVICREIQGVTMSDGSQPKAQSERSIRKWWMEFLPAVHLWAAHALLSEGTRSTDPEGLLDHFASRQALLRLLGCAKHLRQRGETFIAETWLPGPRRRPALSGDSWAAPSDLSVPSLRVESPRRMTDRARQQLETYK